MTTTEIFEILMLIELFCEAIWRKYVAAAKRPNNDDESI